MPYSERFPFILILYIFFKTSILTSGGHQHIHPNVYQLMGYNFSSTIIHSAILGRSLIIVLDWTTHQNWLARQTTKTDWSSFMQHALPFDNGICTCTACPCDCALNQEQGKGGERQGKGRWEARKSITYREFSWCVHRIT